MLELTSSVISILYSLYFEITYFDISLSDMSKPINVLTGLDYWLDNLMCKLLKLLTRLEA